jgi:hypothetical protein
MSQPKDKDDRLTVAHLATSAGFKRNLELLRTEKRKFKTLEDAQRHDDMMRTLEVEYRKLLQAERNAAVIDRDKAESETKRRAVVESKLAPLRTGGKAGRVSKKLAPILRHIRALRRRHPGLSANKYIGYASPKILKGMSEATFYDHVRRVIAEEK